MNKNFKSTGGKTVRIALLDGHVTLVEPSWTSIHKRFWNSAYASGCISEDMVKNTSTADIDPRVISTMNNIALQKNEVADAIRKLVRDNSLEAFDSRGKPKAVVLTEMVGFRVTNAVRDEVWYRVQQESNNEST